LGEEFSDNFRPTAKIYKASIKLEAAVTLFLFYI